MNFLQLLRDPTPTVLLEFYDFFHTFYSIRTSTLALISKDYILLFCIQTSVQFYKCALLKLSFTDLSQNLVQSFQLYVLKVNISISLM